MPAEIRVEPQYTINLESDTPIPAVKPKRKPTAKWSWTDEELAAMLPLANEFDACLITGLCTSGHRISAFLSIQVDEVMDAQGQVREYVMVPHTRLKGGKGTGVIVPKAPDHYDASEGKCWCPGCRRYRGELPPIKRRPPDDRTTPMGAWAPYVEQRLDALAKRYHCTRAELYGKGLYLMASRKTRARVTESSKPRPISRQQAWFRLYQLQVRASIDPYLHACHGARKTSARWMMEETGRIDVVRDWLGHRSSATTDQYLRSDNRERLAIAATVSTKHLPALHVVPPPPPATVPGQPKRRTRKAA
jgi:integrase